MSFDELGLSAELLRAIREEGYDEPTPIQRAAIPPVLQGRDVMAAAQTGTGKTAGFTLPVLHLLSAGQRTRAPRTLILTPTRELAAQIEQSVKAYGKYLDHKTAVVFGGVNIKPQIATLERGIDVLVATPGRLLDLAGQRAVDLSAVKILVLDEADRMLDMGFIHDIRRVMKYLPEKSARQNLLFSATFPKEIRTLSRDLLNDPVLVEVAPPNATADRVDQGVYMVEKGDKRAVLSALVGDGDWRQVLVFTRTKHGANRLAQQLETDGLGAMAIHGNKSQSARTRALEAFKSNSLRVLVATDIAARGLDIEELPYVVNYELPNVPEDYVHRIGRTARAGQSGHAVSLVDAEERKLLRDIERLIGRQLPRLSPVPDPDAPRRQREPDASIAERASVAAQAQGGNASRGGRGGRGGGAGRRDGHGAAGGGRSVGRGNGSGQSPADGARGGRRRRRGGSAGAEPGARTAPKSAT